MLTKRLIATVLVRDGWVVQSFGFTRRLPIGRPETVVENLDRWGVDGIAVISLDQRNHGPDLGLVERICKMGISTPLTYGGGIRNERDARLIIEAGAERIVIERCLRKGADAVKAIGDAIGKQAVIGSLPVISDYCGASRALKMRINDTGGVEDLDSNLVEVISGGLLSELLVMDVESEGGSDTFQEHLLDLVGEICVSPMLAFGGISSAASISPLLKRKDTVGVLVGNSLNYREHAVQSLRDMLRGMPVRTEAPWEM